MAKLIDLIPYRLRSEPVADFENAIQPSLDALEAAFLAMTENIVVDTAEDWLGLWEWAYGLTASGGLELRRAAVRAKMRGAATTTEELIRSVASAYSVEPAELVVDNPHYSFYIYLFTDTAKEPGDLAVLRAVIEEIKPAHLAFDIYLQADAADHRLYAAGVLETRAVYDI